MYKALVSFAGKVSMYKGEVKEITDKAVVEDLLNAKYIEKVETQPKETITEKVIAPIKKNKNK